MFATLERLGELDRLPALFAVAGGQHCAVAIGLGRLPRLTPRAEPGLDPLVTTLVAGKEATA